MSSFLGRYLRVEVPQIGLDFVSDFDKDQNKKQPPRIVVQATLERGAFTQGKVVFYGLNPTSNNLLQQNNYVLNIYAGYSNQGNGLIIQAKKQRVELLRIGKDLQTIIYFLSTGLEKKEALSVPQSYLQELITSECLKAGYKTYFENNILTGRQVLNVSLKGSLFDRLAKLSSLFGFAYYEQGNQITISSDTEEEETKNYLEIDTTDGLLNIPTYSDFGVRVNFKMMMNWKVFIGKFIRLTNKYERIGLSDQTKTFAGEQLTREMLQIKDINFKVFNMIYDLDTRGVNFDIDIEALRQG